MSQYEVTVEFPYHMTVTVQGEAEDPDHAEYLALEDVMDRLATAFPNHYISDNAYFNTYEPILKEEV